MHLRGAAHASCHTPHGGAPAHPDGSEVYPSATTRTLKPSRMKPGKARGARCCAWMRRFRLYTCRQAWAAAGMRRERPHHFRRITSAAKQPIGRALAYIHCDWKLLATK